MADNAQTATTTATNTTETAPTIESLQAELERVTRERDTARTEAETQKKMKDKYAGENAEMKRREADHLTEEERKEREWQELVAAKERAEQENARMKLERDGLASGFTADETTELIESNFSFKKIADIISKKVDEATKSAKAEFTKGSTTQGLMGKGTATNAEEKSAFQKHQESRRKNTDIVNL